VSPSSRTRKKAYRDRGQAVKGEFKPDVWMGTSQIEKKQAKQRRGKKSESTAKAAIEIKQKDGLLVKKGKRRPERQILGPKEHLPTGSGLKRKGGGGNKLKKRGPKTRKKTQLPSSGET